MSLKGLTINTPPEMEAHIKAQDDRSVWESIFGMDAVLDVGNKLNGVLVSNNQLRIYDGVLVAGGAIGRIPFGEYEDVEIENGTQGQLRNDLIIAEIQANTAVEEMKITYVKGTPGETAVDPEYTEGNVYEGDTVRQYPIYRVRLNGLNVEGVDCLFEVLPNIAGLRDGISELNSNLNIKYGNWIPTALNNIKINSYSGCRYYKIGKLVYIEGTINCAATGTAGQNLIGGLPYKAIGQSTIAVNYSNLRGAEGISKFDFNTNPGQTNLLCVYWALRRSWNGDNGMDNAPGVLMFSGTYLTNS